MTRAIKMLSINFLDFPRLRNPKYDIIRDNVSPEKERAVTK